ncbi:mitochondrial-processing peptidase subunit alpha [Halictus rubicundus]|uniref:mitochondrial-processing peptidase subunit alpha n=1 Tax=Halictus rubicundus TaxID=77578 RepID=UPI004035BE0A
MHLLTKVSRSSTAVALKKSAMQRQTFSFLSKCSFSSQKVINTNITRKSVITNHPPLTKPIPNLPKAVYATKKEEHQTTKVTVLPNGLRVASENRFGQFCTVGVLLDSGPRYEIAYPSGISHFLEKLAFGSTKVHESKDQIMLALEKHGGICDCQASRDTFVYAASAERQGLDTVVQILGDISLRPKITEEELNLARQMIRFELESLLTRPEQEPILMDMIHAAAYRSNTLGLPKICPEENIDYIDRKILFQYMKNHHTPNRMVVAGVGVEHEHLVSAVQKHFVEKKTIWEEEEAEERGKDSNLVSSGKENEKLNAVDTSIAQYTGGYILEECNVPVYAGPSGLPELSHVVIGLEGCSHQDSDFVAMCVLNMMMGGGGSFSAGGPGKGMYTRLYTNVLNRYHWLYSATAYNHAYADTGLFCIHASCTPSHVKEMVEVIVHEMVAMTSNITDSELARAKKQLQSMLLMNLEQRPVVFEDIGRQVLATGSRKRPEYFIKAIDEISKDHISNVARRLLKSPPCVAARGEVRTVPSIGDIQAGLTDEQGRLPGSRNRLSLFR